MSHRHHDDSQKRAARLHRQQEMGGRFTYPEGKHTFRVLDTPADKERNSPRRYQEYNMHYEIGPNKRPARCGAEPGDAKPYRPVPVPVSFQLVRRCPPFRSAHLR